MNQKDVRQAADRDRTDGSLRSERHGVDHEAVGSRSREEKDADDLVHRARERTNQILEVARVEAETGLEKADALPKLRAIIRAERAAQSAVLRAERTTEDAQLR